MKKINQKSSDSYYPPKRTYSSALGIQDGVGELTTEPCESSDDTRLWKVQRAPSQKKR